MNLEKSAVQTGIVADELRVEYISMKFQHRGCRGPDSGVM